MLQYQPSSDAVTSVMRLRDDPQPATPNTSSSQPAPTRQSRKRKTPPSSAPAPPQPPQPQPQQQHPPPPPGIHLGHMLPPPHALIPPGMGHPPMYQVNPLSSHSMASSPDPESKSGGRQLSQSKRAEQNRKAQRAFRERRDQPLESRSQLLDAALASADEANRRWEECRALVDQLRIENAALRAALSGQAQLNGSLAPGQILPGPAAAAAATTTSAGGQARRGKARDTRPQGVIEASLGHTLLSPHLLARICSSS
ncbi:hypothetical protein J3R83DRAFT_3466 [Lanmaoa asiatica]|nr:hypothetical protein J3R83DRAFT_3466 [Lanmaoa asiatica]